MVNWIDRPASGGMTVGSYYRMVYHLNFDVAEMLQPTLTALINNAPEFKGPIKIKSVTYTKMYDSANRRDGMDITVVYQALPHPLIEESGLDIRGVIGILGVVVLGILAANGSIKSFAEAAASGAEAAKEALNPAVIVGVIIILMLVGPMLAKGR